MIRAAILQIEKDTGNEVDDAKIIDIIAKEMKKKKDAMADFEKAGRQDLIDQTNEEMKVLEEYLPKQLSREEIKGSGIRRAALLNTTVFKTAEAEGGRRSIGL